MPSLQNYILSIRPALIHRILNTLRDASASGSDRISTIILKNCVHFLTKPVRLLICSILRHGIWLSIWKHYWIHLLLKRGTPSLCKNYRGIQLTHQISKVIERVMAYLLKPTIQRFQLFGPAQFAYTHDYSSRDAVLFMVTSWLLALSSGKLTYLVLSIISVVDFFFVNWSIIFLRICFVL